MSPLGIGFPRAGQSSLPRNQRTSPPAAVRGREEAPKEPRS